MAEVKPRPADSDGDLPNWVEVVRVGRCDWRVSDSRIAVTDPGHVLGYVEKFSRSQFEVLWMTNPMRWGRVDNLAAAIANIAHGRSFGDTTTAERGESIRQRPTLLPHRIRHRTATTPVLGERVA
jgi:hypothetical protein